MPGYTNPQNLNRYGYVLNNPLRYTDPNGHRPDDGCRTGEGCNVTGQTIIDDNKRANDFRNTTERNKCKAGNKNSCSYAENHPLETAGFVITGLVAGPLAENFILEGGAAGATDAIIDKVVISCLRSAVCRLATGMAGGVGGAGAQDTNLLVQQAQQQYPNKAGKIELHHIFPKYLGGDPNGDLVPIDAAYHQLITNAFRELWPYGQGAPTLEEAQGIMRQVYNRFPLP